MAEQNNTSDENRRDVFNKLTLICRNIKEVIGIDELAEKIKLMCRESDVKNKHNDSDSEDSGSKSGIKVRGYWGTAPTTSPSIAYLIPLMKFKDMIDAGIEMTLFIADTHSYLDKGCSWIEKTNERTDYYVFIINTILKSLGVRNGTYNITRGSNVQVGIGYILNLYKFMSRITLKQAQKAGSDVVKKNKDPTIGSLVYPLMQVMDENALDADVELGGVDQRKIFALSRDYAESMGHDKCSYLMNEMLPSLSKAGTKMSSSDANSKIEFTDSEKIIENKIKKAYCFEGEVKDNPCVMMYKLILWPLGYKFPKKQIVYNRASSYTAPLGKEKYSNNDILHVANSQTSKSDEYTKSEDTIPKSDKKQSFNSAEASAVNSQPSLSSSQQPVIAANIIELSYHEFEEQWKNKDISAQELKQWLVISINQVIDPIRKAILENKELYDAAFS